MSAMLHVVDMPDLSPWARAAGELGTALRARVQGEVSFDPGTRALYATDASQYRRVPIGVVRPRHDDDVAATLELCRQHNAPVLGRGAGTSVAGQCCNTAVVMDFSRHMNRILEIDPERRLARVQPGVILDDLQRAAGAYGLRFGPDPSTHEYCTLGGIIGNNACGVHSLMAALYGSSARTEDSVAQLHVITYAGDRFDVGQRVGPGPGTAMGTANAINGALERLGRDYAARIRQRLASVPQRMSGYNLQRLLPEQFHAARTLVGTESTCVLILEATLQLIPAIKHRMLVLAGYPTIWEAADDAPRARSLNPLACDGLDSRLTSFLRKQNKAASSLQLLPQGEAWLMLEVGADSLDETWHRAKDAAATLERAGRPVKIVSDPHGQGALRQVPEAGLGATPFVAGERTRWPVWEDSAVEPEHLGAYLRDLDHLFRRYDLESSVYGHFGQGCVHCRIGFDLESKAGVERYRRFTRDAAGLVARYGGSMSGEHGDGQSRGDLLPILYGEELVTAFRRLKAIWDPNGRMNPGKVVDAMPRTSNLRLEAPHQPEPDTVFRFPEDHHSFRRATLRCVGVGKCRRKSGGIMCPSYRVTHDEKHTTRGRAHLLYEMFRGDVLTQGWNSQAVKSSLDLCLGCKGCKAECPVNVDIGTYKAEFLHHYYQAHPRPRHAHTLGQVRFWASLASRVPAVANWVTGGPGVGPFARWLAGVSPGIQLPPVARPSFTSWFRRVESTGSGPSVILWPDTFNNYFHPEVLEAGVRVLASAGRRVFIPDGAVCCGRPLYDYGFLPQAKRQWQRVLRVLQPAIEAGTPVVGLEPSCVAALRDELLTLLPERALARRLAANTYTLSDYLCREVPSFYPRPLQGRAVVQVHCHQAALLGADSELLLLRRAGLEVAELNTGCCGMAGGFGLAEETHPIATAIARQGILPALEQHPNALIVADGFSCREQVRLHTHRKAAHLAEVLQQSRTS